MAHIKTKYSGLWHPESTHEKIESQRMFIENIVQHENNYVDLVKRVHTKVDSISELKELDVTSDDTVIVDGTVILVTGMGVYYYTITKPSMDPDDESIVLPTVGSGWWVLAGSGGNLVVSDDDYGEDDDISGSGLKLKVKQLFDRVTKQKIYPLTTLFAVKDPISKKSLSDLLIIGDDKIEPTEEVDVRDADTLGGKYKATDIDKSVTFNEDEELEEVEDVKIVDADRLGGKYTSKDIDNIKNSIEEMHITLTDFIVEVECVKSVTRAASQSSADSFVIDVPVGYKLLCASGFSVGSNNLKANSMYRVDNTTIRMDIANTISSTVTANCTVMALCIKA